MERPTAAERARTLAYGMADGLLATEGLPAEPVPAHGTDRTGRPLLLMPARSPAVAALSGQPDLPATLLLTDVAPVPMADRVRGRAWAHGWLTEIPAEERQAAALRLNEVRHRSEPLHLDGGTLLALEIAAVEVDDLWGQATVEPEEYAAAAPDPFVAVEAAMLTHLDSCHRTELAALPAVRAGRPEPAPAVRPLALDRHGLWLRCPAPERGSAPADLRAGFAVPARDLAGLRRAYRHLFAVTRTW